MPKRRSHDTGVSMLDVDSRIRVCPRGARGRRATEHPVHHGRRPHEPGLGVLRQPAGEFARTPNIDRLADEGARLTNCFCTNSICVPSRGRFLPASTATSMESRRSPGPSIRAPTTWPSGSSWPATRRPWSENGT